MNLRRTGAVTRKEMRHILRDPRSLTMALAVPILMLLLFGLALLTKVQALLLPIPQPNTGMLVQVLGTPPGLHKFQKSHQPNEPPV